jgi:hypothetical protein
MRSLLACVTILLAGAAQAADGTYEVSSATVSAGVGTPTKVGVTIRAKGGWHLNHEAPLTLKLTPTAGVTIDKPQLSRADLASSSDSEARFDVSLVLTDTGKKAVEGETRFVLCQKDACRPIKEKLTLNAEATAPAKAAKPAKKRKK